MLFEVQQKLLEIVDNLIINPIAEAFVKPYEGDPNYDQIIQNKMDLTTIKKKLEQGKYISHLDLFKDLELVWQNCQKYNQVGSVISKQSIYLQQLCKSLKKTIEIEFNLVKKKKKPINQEKQQQLQQQQQQFDYRQKNKPSNDASRLRFCYQMKNLDEQQLIKIVNYLAEHQPESLSRDGDELIINVKLLDSKACDQVNLF